MSYLWNGTNLKEAPCKTFKYNLRKRISFYRETVVKQSYVITKFYDISFAPYWSYDNVRITKTWKRLKCTISFLVFQRIITILHTFQNMCEKKPLQSKLVKSVNHELRQNCKLWNDQCWKFQWFTPRDSGRWWLRTLIHKLTLKD